MSVYISIVYVNYKTDIELLKSIKTISKSFLKVFYEIIVVDNNTNCNFKNKLIKIPRVKYIKSEKNLGFSGGNNLGAKSAKGEYLFFLNPDTKLLKNSVDNLFNYIKNNKNVGIVSPLLVDENLNSFKTQSRKELTLVNALYSFSFLKKIFPSKSIYNDKFFDTWNKISPIEVDTVPGAALMISKKLFNKVGGFDERFFLYFEENDLSKRVRNLGYKLFIFPKSKIIHMVGQSTKQIENRDAIFEKSRFLYFKKHYGLIKSLGLEFFLRINKNLLVILMMLVASIFLRIINLSVNMQFIGDQGWFYLSARELLINGKIPLVGITSSHTWLHQGPLWTYMLSFPLLIFRFNPISGAFLTAIFGVLTTFLIYKLGSSMFSKKVGFISGVFYAISPLVVFFDRIPFDPSPIPFFTVLYFYAVYKWINGNIRYFPFAVMLIALLYNLELATFTLFFPSALLFIYGFIWHKDWAIKILNKKTIIYSVFAFIISMLPVIIYDFSNGFKQTVVFLGWTFYKPFSFLIKHSSENLFSNFKYVLEFLAVNVQKLVFEQSFIISISIFILSAVFLIYSVAKYKKFKINDSRFILLFFLFFSLSGILINQTPSDAYLPIIFPFVFFTVGLFFERVLINKKTKYFGILILLIILISNFISSYNNSFVPYFKNRMIAVDKIISLANGKEYNLIGKGPGSQFESFTMNYEYLLWWKGHPPSKNEARLKVIILETEKGIIISKKYD